VRIIHEIVDIFINAHVMRSAASLAYFLTISIFPLLLCIVAIPGSTNWTSSEIAVVLKEIIPGAAMLLINEFLDYVSGNMSVFMMILGITSMITTSAAVLRVIMGVMGEIQGEIRFHGLLGHLMSFLLSFGLLAAVYLSGLVIVTGEWFHGFLQDMIPAWDMSYAWLWVRFIILFAIMFTILLVVYVISAPKKTKIKERLVGAAAAGILMVVVSGMFSKMISASARYTVVYGSLASIIIMMVWIYVCSAIILMCNVLNIAIVRSRRPKIINNL